MIKIKKTSDLTAFEEYIKGQQPLVRCVYSSSIYFFGGQNDCQYAIHFDLDLDRNRNEIDKIMLKAINAACNTEFEFDIEDETN